MTKRNFLQIFAVLILTVVMFSCNKETEVTQIETNSDEAVLQRILDFKTDVENPNNLKSDEMISVEDAVWLVEAALNYTYCMTYEDMPEVDYMQLDSTDINFNYSTEINYSNVIEIYNNFSVWFEETKAEYETTDIFFTIADVYTVDNLIRVKALIEYGHANELKSTQTYTIYGDWKWGKKLGNCSGQYMGQRDASTEINRYLQSVLNPLQAYDNSYFTDVENMDILGSWVEPNFQGLIWCDHFPIGFNYCMPESDVRYWAQKSVIAQQNARAYCDPLFLQIGREFQKVSFGWESIIVAGQIEYCYHKLTEYYGVKHTSPIVIEL